jgi:hypothetical protein
MSAAGPRQGHLCERGEAQARRARPRARVAADTPAPSMPHGRKEAAWNCSPGGSAAAELSNEAASVGAHV